MAWTTPANWPVGYLVTSAFLHAQVRDNMLELRGGGLAISGQVAGCVPYATSTTQLVTTAQLSYADGDGLLSVVKSHNSSIGISALNATSGTGAFSFVQLQANPSDVTLYCFSGGFSTSGALIAGSGCLSGSGGEGLVYQAANAGGKHRWYTSNTETMRLHASGGLSIGSTSDPSTGGLLVAGNVSISSVNITDGAGTPTIASGFGSSPSIAGKSYAFEVTIGSSPGSSGVVNFGTTFANPPVVIALVSGGNPGGIVDASSATTTQVTLQNRNVSTGASLNFTAANIVHVLVRGY